MRGLPKGLLAVVVVVPAISGAAHAARGADASALANAIDAQIQTRLDAESLPRAPQADDAEFLRRAFLDLHGIVPSAARAKQFLDDADANKRAKLIDELLAAPRFGEYFADVWRKSLISAAANEERMRTDRFAALLAERFNAGDGWDKIVYDLLTATGKIDENPAVSYLIEGRYPLTVTDLTDLSSRYFLGVRLNCVQCHDHPFTEMKRSEYWGMAAFFAQIQTPGRAKAAYMQGIRDDPKVTMKVMAGTDMIEGLQLSEPTFLGGEKLQDDGTPHRVALARWMTSPDNPYFARAAVNRLWWHFFGRGIVNPVDDMHAANEPSHPELLDRLTREFVASGFDLKFLSRAILNSRTYGQTSRPGKEAEREGELFARMSIKVLTAEQLYDSLVAVLGEPAKGSGGPDMRFGARHEFGRAFAGNGDPEPLRYDRGIPHVLRMMNSPQFASRNITELVTRLERENDSSDAIVEQLFLTILARRPTAAERQLTRESLEAADATAANVYRELAWALLMSSEFSLNH